MSEKSSLYRNFEVRKRIHVRAEEIFGGEKISDEQIDHFFLLQGTKLSDDERRDVVRWSAHLGKRLVHAALKWPGRESSSVDEAIARLEERGESFGFNAFHDPAHALMEYDSSGGRSLIPKYMKMSDAESLQNPDIIREEFPASLWGTPMGKINSFTALLSKDSAKQVFEALRDRVSDAKQNPYEVEYLPLIDRMERDLDPNDFDSVRKTFETVVTLFIKTISSDAIQPDLLRANEAAIDQALLLSQQHPDPKYLMIARRIFDEYPTNKKVYFEEFERISRQLLERLRRKDALL